MKNNPTDFVVVTKENIKNIARILTIKKGKILIADPDYAGVPEGCIPSRIMGTFRLHLFGRAKINLKDTFFGQPSLEAMRGTKIVNEQNWQTGWEKDREYRLYPTPQSSGDKIWDAAREYFQYLQIGDEYRYRFKIDFQSTVGMSLDTVQNMVLYIPKYTSPRAGLVHALTWMTDLFNKQTARERNAFCFSKTDIERMVAYALKDLKTGEVLRHNVEAGRDADATVGLAPRD